jgi:hypothetical protein
VTSVVARRGEEQVGLTQDEGLLLRLVADVEHRDVGAYHPSLGISTTPGNASAIARTATAGG